LYFRVVATVAASNTPSDPGCWIPMGARALSAQMLNPALAEITGARRLWTVSMISAVSMPSR
jgi:hypothetical protein